MEMGEEGKKMRKNPELIQNKKWNLSKKDNPRLIHSLLELYYCLPICANFISFTFALAHSLAFLCDVQNTGQTKKKKKKWIINKFKDA